MSEKDLEKLFETIGKDVKEKVDRTYTKCLFFILVLSILIALK